MRSRPEGVDGVKISSRRMAHGHDALPAYLPSAAKFALTVALGCAYILQPLLDFVEAGVSGGTRSPVLDAAVAVVLVTLPATYLAGVTLVYLHVAAPAPAPPAGTPKRRIAYLAACSLAFALLVAVAAFLFLAVVDVDGSRPGGFTPT